MNSKLKIIHIASEVDPFSKTGGLADVVRSLPKAQKKLGHQVAVITPLYGKIINKKKHKLKLIAEDIEISLNSKDKLNVSYYKGYLKRNLPVYFIEQKKFFSKRKTLYGSSRDNARFLIFDVAVLRLLKLLEFNPDIIHCHDWHTGLIPYYIKTKFHYAQGLQQAKTVYTIHNLAYQMGKSWWQVPRHYKDFGKTKLPRLDDKKIEYINFAKRAILTADIINTVSEQYAQEIRTKKFGQDLNRILKNRGHKLFGIVNGIDYKHYNPATDLGLQKNYSYKNINGHKKANKLYLQKKFKLPQAKDTPLITMTSRIDIQKGFELILKIGKQLMQLDLQFIIIGSGDKEYIKQLQKLAKKYPKKMVIIPSHDECLKYETLIYAGGDMTLLPSSHEPCGLVQMKAMRYGCVPVVHKVGGLSDTVRDYGNGNQQGTGFVFDNFDSYELYGAIVRALEVYKNKKEWKNIITTGMKESNSWEIPAKTYIDLYKHALK